MNNPKVVQKFPYKVTVESEKSYWWCSCRKSSKQPFCDGSHEGTEFLPLKVKLDEEKEVFFCGCKMSKNGSFCDGTHKDL
jgi:CDGSH-type Zn-finger protein